MQSVVQPSYAEERCRAVPFGEALIGQTIGRGEGGNMYNDPMNNLKTELENVRARRKELEKALKRLIAERQRTAESLGRLAGGIAVDEKPKQSVLLGVMVLSTLTTLLTGVVLSRFWSWFLVEPFNLPRVSAVEATGAYLLISLLGSHSETTPKELPRAAAVLALRLGIVWFLGWLLHWLV